MLHHIRGMAAILPALGALLFAANFAEAADLHVPGDYATIQAAINASSNGDTVIVADGTYTGDGNRDLTFFGRQITVRSENGPLNCIIDPQGSAFDPHRGVFFSGGETSATVFEGFTVRNGYGNFGGGIRCGGASPTIRNCIVIDNECGFDGGGVAFSNSDAVIINCVIVGNTASGGAGISCFNGSDATIVNCTISDNTAGNAGGGILTAGGASDAVVTNCAIWGNSPDQITVSTGDPVFTYCNVEGGWAGDGNINADPQFNDPGNGDYNIPSGSPCVDAGDNSAVPAGVTLDILGGSRFVDDPNTPDTGNGTPPLVDIGAFEVQALLPDGFTVVFGSLLSGVLGDLFFSDDSYVIVQEGPAFAVTLPSIRVEIEATAPTDTASRITFRVESSSTAAPPIVEQRVELYNYATSSWVVWDSRTATSGDQVVDVVVAVGASDYVEPGTNKVKARVSLFDPGTLFTPGWTLKIDQAVWAIVP